MRWLVGFSIILYLSTLLSTTIPSETQSRLDVAAAKFHQTGQLTTFSIPRLNTERPVDEEKTDSPDLGSGYQYAVLFQSETNFSLAELPHLISFSDQHQVLPRAPPITLS